MTVRLNPYLNYKDQAREAMSFYHSVLGGELTMMTFGEMDPSSATPDGIMHAQLQTPDGFTLMAADTPSYMEFTGQSGVSVSLSGDDEARLRGWFDGLSDGADVLQPLEQAPWGAIFGMLVDRFGTTWLVNVGPQ